MCELTTQGRLVLLAVVSKAAKEEPPCRTREGYREYTTLCDSVGTETLAQRSVHTHRSDLRMLGMLSASENRNGARGNDDTYALNVPVRSAIDAMADGLRLSSDIETVRAIAARNTGVSHRRARS